MQNDLFIDLLTLPLIIFVQWVKVLEGKIVLKNNDKILIIMQFSYIFYDMCFVFIRGIVVGLRRLVDK